MNKRALVHVVARRLGTTVAKAVEITDLFFAPNGLIASELRRGGKVSLSGFGSFETRQRAAREGRNPRTGKAVSIGAATIPVFRAGKGMKEAVNRRKA